MKACPFCAERIQRAATLCRFCGKEQPPDSSAGVFRGAELAMGFGAFCLVGALLYAGLGGSAGVAQRFPWVEEWAQSFRAGFATAGPASALVEAVAEPAPPPPPPPASITQVLDTVMRVPAGEHFDTAFSVHDSRPCTLRGRVQGVDGGRRDVEVFVLDEDGFLNWHNGVAPAALHETGRTSASTFEVPLPKRGTFRLLVSNRFSVFTAKTVRIENAHVFCGTPEQHSAEYPSGSAELSPPEHLSSP